MSDRRPWAPQDLAPWRIADAVTACQRTCQQAQVARNHAVVALARARAARENSRRLRERAESLRGARPPARTP